MFIPIIIDPCAFYEYRYLWEYLKYLYHCKDNHWPLIASYEFQLYKEKRPISNAYNMDFMEQHRYKLLTKEEEKEIDVYFFSRELFDKLRNNLGSELSTKLFLLENRYVPFERELKRIIRLIKQKYKENIEGFITWNAHFKSVDYFAGKLRIPVITNEFSLRSPEYRPLSYFCLDSLYDSNEIKKMYERFENNLMDFDYFTRDELLALFLKEDRLNEILNKKEEIYEMGVGGCHPLIATFFAKSKYTDLELIQDVRNQYSEDDFIFRMHPGDEPYRATYTVKNIDNSEYASDFIRKCKRITAQGSNILLEAMLWGKKVYSHDVSPFTFLCENNLEKKDTNPVNDIALNFLLLVYLVPFEKICDVKYMRWRLQEKNLNNIYIKNLKFYLNSLNIPEAVVGLKKDRLKKILELRGVNVYE